MQGVSGVGKSALSNVLLGQLLPDCSEVRREPGLPPHALQKLYQNPVSAFAPQAALVLKTHDEDITRQVSTHVLRFE